MVSQLDTGLSSKTRYLLCYSNYFRSWNKMKISLTSFYETSMTSVFKPEKHMSLLSEKLWGKKWPYQRKMGKKAGLCAQSICSKAPGSALKAGKNHWGTPGPTHRDPEFTSLGKHRAMDTLFNSPEPLLSGNWRLCKSANLGWGNHPSTAEAIRGETFRQSFGTVRTRRGSHWP